MTTQTHLQWLPELHVELSAPQRILAPKVFKLVGRLSFEGSPRILAVVSQSCYSTSISEFIICDLLWMGKSGGHVCEDYVYSPNDRSCGLTR